MRSTLQQLLLQQEIPTNQQLNICAHEAAIRIIGMQTMRSPLTLKLVLTSTGHSVALLNAEISAWNRGFVSVCTVCTRAE